jgi:GntR family galactonate operon transcriptional repressor
VRAAPTPGTRVPIATTPRRPARLADLVVEAITDGVVGGTLEPATVLPPESALAEQFQVSRVTVREAVKLLEAKGLLEVRHGIGAVVRERAGWNLLDTGVLAAAVHHDGSVRILDELVGVRIALESSLAGLAAERATDEDRAAIAGLYRQLEAEVRAPEVFIETDMVFHDRIMVAAGNDLARSIMTTVHGQVRTSMRYQGRPSVEDVTVTNQEHGRVLERVLDRDAEGASREMAAHIGAAWKRRRPAPEPA